MTLSMIISTYQRPLALAKVLAGVAQQTRPADEVLIADDGSDNATREVLQNWGPGLKSQLKHVWQSHEGFRKAIVLNKAVNLAKGDYLVFLDGDCVPERHFLADHEELIERGFWVQGRRCFVKEPFVDQFEAGVTVIWRWLLSGRISGGFKAFRFPRAVVRRDQCQKGIIGCNMGLWREDLLAINGFDESYIGWGREDSDLGSRLYHLGRSRKLIYGRAIVYHLNHPPLPRDRFEENDARLAETLRSRKIRCEHGLAQHA